MRIAQIAPLIERVPPVGYGGTELVVSLLTEGLAKRGHEVTLFASGDSVTTARLRALTPTYLRALALGRICPNKGTHLAVYERIIANERPTALREPILVREVDLSVSLLDSLVAEEQSPA